MLKMSTHCWPSVFLFFGAKPWTNGSFSLPWKLGWFWMLMTAKFAISIKTTVGCDCWQKGPERLQHGMFARNWFLDWTCHYGFAILLECPVRRDVHTTMGLDTVAGWPRRAGIHIRTTYTGEDLFDRLTSRIHIIFMLIIFRYWSKQGHSKINSFGYALVVWQSVQRIAWRVMLSNYVCWIAADSDKGTTILPILSTAVTEKVAWNLLSLLVFDAGGFAQFGGTSAGKWQCEGLWRGLVVGSFFCKSHSGHALIFEEAFQKKDLHPICFSAAVVCWFTRKRDPDFGERSETWYVRGRAMSGSIPWKGPLEDILWRSPGAKTRARGSAGSPEYSWTKWSRSKLLFLY